MSKVLVISGHPNLETSHANAKILALVEQGLDSVNIRKLDELYPDFSIDIEAEQQALMEHDIIVLQFPFHWYSVPALLKQWIDQVFAFGFAYGSTGDKLKDKLGILSITVGGPDDSYSSEGYNRYTIEALMPPLEQTLHLAQMRYSAPVYTKGMVYIPGVYGELSDVIQKAEKHAQRLIDTINAPT